MKVIAVTQLLAICYLVSSISYVHRSESRYLADNKVPAQAKVNGKYINLLHIVGAPDDKAQYGSFCDWGYWTGSEYNEAVELKPGFWVYVYPNWYVWEKLSAEEKIDKKASVHGKYKVLLHILKVPADLHEYGSFYDWGFSEEYSYAGHENLTPGYWVYVAPHWYVWAEESKTTGGT